MAAELNMIIIIIIIILFRYGVRSTEDLHCIITWSTRVEHKKGAQEGTKYN